MYHNNNVNVNASILLFLVIVYSILNDEIVTNFLFLFRWLIRTCKVEIPKEKRISSLQDIIVTTFLTNIGRTSLQLEHEIINWKTKEVIARYGGTIVLLSSLETTPANKRELTNVEEAKKIVKPSKIQVETSIPPRPSNAYLYSFPSRPSDNVSSSESVFKLNYLGK